MPKDAKIEFLRAAGQAKFEHASHVPFLSHLAPEERGFAHGVLRLSAHMMPQARMEFEGVLTSVGAEV